MWPCTTVDLTFPFRRFQIGKVYRGERAQRGRLPGILPGRHRHHRRRQAGHSQRGGDPLHHLQDLHRPGAQALQDPGEQPQGTERPVFELLGLKEQAADVMRTVDKLEKIGRDKVIQILTERLRRGRGTPPAPCWTPWKPPTPWPPCNALRRQGCPVCDRGVEELSTVVRYMGCLRRAPRTTISRGPDHRPRAWTTTPAPCLHRDRHDRTTRRSAPSAPGGRYDNLAEYYTDKTDSPAWASPSA